MSAACEALLIRNGSLIIRNGNLILCDTLAVAEESVIGGAAGGLGLPGRQDELDKAKKQVDIAVAELLLLSLTRKKE